MYIHPSSMKKNFNFASRKTKLNQGRRKVVQKITTPHTHLYEF